MTSIKTINLFILVTLIITQVESSSKINITPSLLNSTIEKAKQNIWNRQETDPENKDHWNYPTYLGSFFLSLYYMEMQAMGWQNITKFNATQHREIVLSQQLTDGSWQQLEDENEHSKSLDASIAHYWFLKSVGEDANSERMQKAKQWILDNGGIEAAQQMTRYKMAVYGQYDWANTLYIPLIIFNPKSMFSYFLYAKDIVAQWVYPHLTSFGYLRYFRIYEDNINCADIFELWKNPPKNNRLNLSQRETGKEPDAAIVTLVEEIFSVWRPKGSFGTYTVSTLLNIVCLKHFRNSWPGHPLVPKIDLAIQKAFDFIEMNLFNPYTPYTGQLDDGRWWDTMLVSIALLEAGENPKKLEPVADKMIKDALQVNGGIAYGWEFEYAPDTDDTSMFITMLEMLNNRPKYQFYIEQSFQFTLSQQNSNGGFPAFHHNREGTFLYEWGAKLVNIKDSAEMFDPSCVDITGHMLESLALMGKDLNHPSVKFAIYYLHDNIQHIDKDKIAWQSRWGINYIYASGAIIPGLSKIGYNLSNNIIKKNINWLKKRQNSDGGFGESVQSYINYYKHNGRGKSTPTITAWALFALLEVTEIYDVKENIENAVKYLLEEFQKSGGNWVDKSVVGTGHRGVLYLQYPAYSQAFPLIALSRYQKLLQRDDIQFKGSKISKDKQEL